MRVLLTIVALFGFVWTITRGGRRDVRRGVVFAWAALWLAVGVVALVPEGTNRAADILGIGRGADVVIYLAIVVILALLFRLSIRVERLDRHVTTLTRELALHHHQQSNSSAASQKSEQSHNTPRGQGNE